MKFLAFLSSAIKVVGSLGSVTSYTQYCTLRAFRQRRGPPMTKSIHAKNQAGTRLRSVHKNQESSTLKIVMPKCIEWHKPTPSDLQLLHSCIWQLVNDFMD